MEQTETEKYLKRFNLSWDDLGLVQKFGRSPQLVIEDMVSDCYDWFDKKHSGAHFPNGLLPYWIQFLEAEVNEDYIERRMALGELYAHIRLPMSTYLEAVGFVQDWLKIAACTNPQGEEESAKTIRALSRLCQLDIAIISETYAEASFQQNAAHQKQLLAVARGDFSTDVTPRNEQDIAGFALRDLTQSLRKFTEISEAIAHRDYSRNVDPGSEDRLGNALQNVIVTLREVTDVCDNAAHGNLSRVLNLEGDHDVLGKSVNQNHQQLLRGRSTGKSYRQWRLHNAGRSAKR